MALTITAVALNGVAWVLVFAGQYRMARAVFASAVVFGIGGAVLAIGGRW